MIRTGWVGRTALVLSLAGAVGVAVVPGAAAQERETECRCVDEAGRELQDCICVRRPNVERIVMGPWGMGPERPRLGISVEMSDADDAIPGARIVGVLEDGPADRAGLREGDVVTSIAGRSLTAPLEVEQERDLDPDAPLPPQRLLALAREIVPGTEVEVGYLRDGQAARTTLEARELDDWGRTFTFVGPEWDAEAFGERMRDFGERMRTFRGPSAPEAPGAPEAPRAFRFRWDEEGLPGFRFEDSRTGGLGLIELNPELGRYFGAERGVLVTSVDDDSALGLRGGDVILSIDGRAVERPERVRSILSSYDFEETVTFRIRRDGREMDVSGRIRG